MRYVTKEDEKGNGNAACLYLRSDHVNWLLQYVADELIFQGVERIQEPEAQKECNSAVVGMHMEWDFERKAWTATFAAGEFVGTLRIVVHIWRQRCRRKI